MKKREESEVMSEYFLNIGSKARANMEEHGVEVEILGDSLEHHCHGVVHLRIIPRMTRYNH